jgi:hypothetical protein
VRFGVIAEGRKDVPVFEELIPKIQPAVVRVMVRPARGKPRFLSVFPPLIWTFQYIEPGGPADKVIVVRDANGENPVAVEAMMRQQITGRRFPQFRGGIEFHATQRETETWLLADVGAINRVAARHGGHPVAAIPGSLEDIPNAKERFVDLLRQAGLPNVPEIVREITREIDLQILRARCPLFSSFEEKARR